MGHLGPSYGMDFDRDYSSYNLGNIGAGNSAGMNDISALAAAASDQLYELERHEAFRRAEFEMRHRQIAGARKSNGNSPSATPNGNGNGSGNGQSNPYGMSSERERFSLHGVATPEGGRMVYPVSAAQPASGNQPAVPSGTLADPSYLVPPTCCHEECHKSYRKRLKYAKQTQACPNCLSQTHGHGAHNGHNGLGGGQGGNSGHHSSGSNTPKDRSKANSSDDLTKLGGGSGGGGGGGGGGGMGGASAYNLHQASLHSQLAKLQQQHLAALQQARSRRSSQQQQHQQQIHSAGGGHRLGQLGQSHAFGGLNQSPYSAAHSAAVSANPSPASSDSEDDDEPMPHPHFEMHEVAHPVMHGMNKMSLFQHRTAPTSAVTSPIHSRNPSRAGSPVEGHSANSGKHGHASHTARDAKHRSHPYTHSSAHHAHYSMPNSPHVNPVSSKHRHSPPDIARSLSGGGGMPRQSVEDILNSSVIPPPPSHSDRMLPPPNSNSSFNSTAPSMSYSLGSTPVQSPSTSRASSPTHTTHHPHSHGHGHSHGHHGHSSHHSSNLAHSVRNAFGMTPISATSSPSGSYKAPGGALGQGMSPPTQHKLAPMGMGGIGVGSMLHHQGGVERMTSQSRGNSPVHGSHGHGHGMKMEVDGQA
jgi:zinc finger protein CreA/MIG